ncbi:MAG: hypothetical protein R6W99_09855 [Clostridia bacterium]
MKSMKKILSAILTVALLAAFIVVPVNAAVSDDAAICETINVLRGDGSGVTEAYLLKSTNRSQGAKILLRLMGLEVEADAYTGTATFSDASDATAYWQPMLAYLKANPGVGFQGYPDGTFAPNRIMTAQEIYKVLLVSLGYVENVDFTWSQVFTFAASKGMTALAGVGQVTNDHLATALVEALQADKKDGQELILFLIDEGVVSLSAAQAAGLVPMVLTVMDAFASGSKEITATLNMAAPAGTTATLKKGSVTWTADVEWNSNRKVVKFTRNFNFTPGEYTVTVGSSTKNLTVLEETLMGISIGADYIFPLANQDLQVSLYNQYGEPMAITNTTVLIYNVNKGTSLVPINMGTTIKVDASNEALVVGGNSLSISVIKGSMNQIKTITVYQKPVIKSLYITGLEIANSAAKIDVNTSGHKLVIEATDQYGNPYKLTPADILTGGKVMITNSNEASVPSSSFAIDANGKLVFNALAAGSSTITIIVPTEGIIRHFTVQVNEPAALKTLVINVGSAMITSGTRYDLTTNAYDQLGSPIALKNNFDFSKFAMFSTNNNVVSNSAIQYDAGTGVLYLLPGMPGQATVTYYYNGIYQGALVVNVNEAPEPQAIMTINIPQYFEVGATRNMTLDDIVVYDQYAQVFDMDGTDYEVQIERTNGTTMTAGATLSDSISPAFTATMTEGTTTFTFRIRHNTLGIVAGSENAKSIEVVGTNDIASFAFDNVGTMYAGGVAMTAYHKTLKISGRIGTKEVVLAGGSAVPSAITLITNSNTTAFTLNTTTLELYASGAGSTIIRAWVGGTIKAEVTVTSSSAVPVVSTMQFNPTSYTMANSTTFDVKTILTIKDQYGVNITSSANVYYSSGNTTLATINQSGIITSYATDGVLSISVIELSGQGSAVLSLTVQ